MDPTSNSRVIFIAASCHLPSAVCSVPSRLAGKDTHIDALGISKYDETNVSHVGIGDTHNILGRNGAQTFEEHCRIAPAAAEQFILCQISGLRRVRLLTEECW